MSNSPEKQSTRKKLIESGVAFSNERIDLHDVVNPRDSTHVKPMAEIQGSPGLIARLFFWSKETVHSAYSLDDHLLAYTYVYPNFEVDAEHMVETLRSVNAATKADYELLYSNQIEKPNYHNWEHAETTASQGLKIFLGGLVELSKNDKFRGFVTSHPGKLQQMVDVAIFMMSRHEQDDWWSRRSVASIAANQVDGIWDENQKKVHANIADKCKELGISKEDFNRMLVLDTFYEPMSASLTKVMGTEPIKEPYFSDTDGKPDFAWLGADEEVQKMFLNLLGESTRAADLSQMFNPNYYRYAILKGAEFPEDGLVTNVGAVALNDEYNKFRPGSAINLGWLNKDGSTNWKVIGTGKKFIKAFALDNIKLGIKYLKNFHHVEGEHVEEIVKALEEAVKD